MSPCSKPPCRTVSKGRVHDSISRARCDGSARSGPACARTAPQNLSGFSIDSLYISLYVDSSTCGLMDGWSCSRLAMARASTCWFSASAMVGESWTASQRPGRRASTAQRHRAEDEPRRPSRRARGRRARARTRTGGCARDDRAVRSANGARPDLEPRLRPPRPYAAPARECRCTVRKGATRASPDDRRSGEHMSTAGEAKGEQPAASPEERRVSHESACHESASWPRLMPAARTGRVSVAKTCRAPPSVRA